MARCPSCNKFCSLEENDPEVLSAEVDSDGNVTADIRVYLTSSCCGDEVKEYNFNVDMVPDGLDDHVREHQDDGEEYELNLEDGDAQFNDRYEDKDRHGRKIKHFRYMRHYYGFDWPGAVECSCGERFEFTASDEEQASAFEELY